MEEIKCPICDEGKISCQFCDETGLIVNPDLNKTTEEYWKKCSHCKGEKYFICSQCGGSGKIIKK